MFVVSEFATYINRFELVANGNNRDILLRCYQEQPLWNNDTQEVSIGDNPEVCKLFISFTVAKQLADVINQCIADHEGTNTGPGE